MNNLKIVKLGDNAVKNKMTKKNLYKSILSSSKTVKDIIKKNKVKYLDEIRIKKQQQQLNTKTIKNKNKIFQKYNHEFEKQKELKIQQKKNLRDKVKQLKKKNNKRKI